MKNNKLKTYILQIVLIVLLLTAFIPQSILNNRGALACFLLLYSLIIKKYASKTFSVSIRKKNVTRLMFFFAILYLALYYVFGLYTGFSKSQILLSFSTFIKFILPVFITILSAEKIRKYFLSTNDKKSNTFVFIIEVIIDMLIYSTNYYLGDIDSFLVAVGYVFFASVSCNLYYNYICKRYGDKPIIIYRAITILYIYIFPYIPSIYVFFKTFCRIIYPIIMFYVVDSMYGERKEVVTKSQQLREKISYGIVFTIGVLFIMLISCKFTYGALVIGSKSMEGSLNMGDVVVYKRYSNNEISVGDVIIFNKSNEYIVHRVVSIKRVNEKYRIYTKGDANVNIDNWYVSDNEILGVVKFNVPNIGKPTLWVKNLFKRSK